MSHITAQELPEGTRLYCTICGTSGIAINQQQADYFFNTHAHGNYGAGDLVHGLTHRMGMKHCTPCERRRQWLNRFMPNTGIRRRY